MKRILSITLIILAVLLCFSGCVREYEPNDEIHTTCEGVFITVESIDESGKFPILEVVWHNETEKTVTFGLWYTIEYLNGGEWKNIQIADFAVPEIALMIEPDNTARESYTTKHFYMLRKGEYRIRTEFYIQGEEPVSGSTWASFSIS